MRKIIPKTESMMVNAMKPQKSRPEYPTVRIDLEHIPEAKKWKLGESYHVEMTLKMVALSQSRFDNSAEFEMTEIDTDDTDDKDDKDDGDNYTE